MKKRVERNTVTTVIFAIVFAILIIYALFVIITLLWGVMTSLKSLEDINGGFNFYTRKNILGFPDLDASHVWIIQLQTGNRTLYLQKGDLFLCERQNGGGCALSESVVRRFGKRG